MVNRFNDETIDLFWDLAMALTIILILIYVIYIVYQITQYVWRQYPDFPDKQTIISNYQSISNEDIVTWIKLISFSLIMCSVQIFTCIGLDLSFSDQQLHCADEASYNSTDPSAEDEAADANQSQDETDNREYVRRDWAAEGQALIERIRNIDWSPDPSPTNTIGQLSPINLTEIQRVQQEFQDNQEWWQQIAEQDPSTFHPQYLVRIGAIYEQVRNDLLTQIAALEFAGDVNIAAPIEASEVTEALAVDSATNQTTTGDLDPGTDLTTDLPVIESTLTGDGSTGPTTDRVPAGDGSTDPITAADLAPATVPTTDPVPAVEPATVPVADPVPAAEPATVPAADSVPAIDPAAVPAEAPAQNTVQVDSTLITRGFLYGIAIATTAGSASILANTPGGSSAEKIRTLISIGFYTAALAYIIGGCI